MPYSPKISGIYTITCSINNKHYVGRSRNCFHRMNQHQVALRNNKHHNFYLQRAYNRYGHSAFKFEILVDYPAEYLFSMERYWINMLDSCNRKFGYNMAIAGRLDIRAISTNTP